jgi:aldose 1-epimerase
MKALSHQPYSTTMSDKEGGTMEALSRRTAAALLITLLLPASRSIPAEQTAPSKLVQPSFSHQSWGHTPDGSPVEIYSLRNAKGMEVRVTTYGAAIVSLTTPDRDGHMADVVLGFDSIEGYTSRAYLRESPYFGAVIGRYANRINKGRFQLNGKLLSLTINNRPNHLHGGIKGFDKVVWEGRASGDAEPSLQLTYESKDGEEGYPGNLRLTVVYTLTDDALKIEYNAIADRDTVVNFTNHSYFNLKGAGEGDILGHELQLNADQFTRVDATLIPTGELRSVKGTPFDFTQPTMIGARIEAKDEQLIFGKGYDQNFVLTGSDGTLRQAARVHEPTTGRSLEVWTTEPGIQFYTGNFLRGDLVGKGGKPYIFRGGLCLETQHFPDSPNHTEFPSTTLKGGGTYTSQTVFRFSVDG